eukprot:COSAG06_NODE_24023_length_675_cov_0.692708_2_plen_32_part_01
MSDGLTAGLSSAEAAAGPSTVGSGDGADCSGW